MAGGAPSEAHQHIVQLSLWLRNHPAADATPARERSLNFWIEVAQEGEVS